MRVGYFLGHIKVFQFHDFFSGNFAKILYWAPPPGELGPPPRGNPVCLSLYLFRLQLLNPLTYPVIWLQVIY